MGASGKSFMTTDDRRWTIDDIIRQSVLVFDRKSNELLPYLLACAVHSQLSMYSLIGQLRDSTLTSAATFVVGLGMLDPTGDLIIDGYASGNAHGWFNGLDALLNGAPLTTFTP